MNDQNGSDSSLVVSYLVLRKAIGILGIGLPFILAIGLLILNGSGIQSSISSYYHTLMGDVFVGILCAIGVFMLSYKGYEKVDNLAGDFACLMALGVALFPVAPQETTDSLVKLVGMLHYIFAALFFLTLAYFSLRLFTKTDPTAPPTRKKLQRNMVYKVCGYLILVSLALIVVVNFLPDSAKTQIMHLDPVFWLEAIAVVAFGFSWLTKGEALLKDET
jgi:hypothetical protein